MSETPGQYAVLSDNPVVGVVECPTCHHRIGSIIQRGEEKWLMLYGLLIPWLPFALCVGCGGAVRFGVHKVPLVAKEPL